MMNANFIFLSLLSLTLTSCQMTMSISKPPTTTAVVSESQNNNLTPRWVCDEYKPPVMPDLPTPPHLSDSELSSSERVAEKLVELFEKFKEVVDLRNDLRLKSFEEHRKSCKMVFINDKTLPE